MAFNPNPTGVHFHPGQVPFDPRLPQNAPPQHPLPPEQQFDHNGQPLRPAGHMTHLNHRFLAEQNAARILSGEGLPISRFPNLHDVPQATPHFYQSQHDFGRPPPPQPMNPFGATSPYPPPPAPHRGILRHLFDPLTRGAGHLSSLFTGGLSDQEYIMQHVSRPHPHANGFSPYYMQPNGGRYTPQMSPTYPNYSEQMPQAYPNYALHMPHSQFQQQDPDQQRMAVRGQAIATMSEIEHIAIGKPRTPEEKQVQDNRINQLLNIVLEQAEDLTKLPKHPLTVKMLQDITLVVIKTHPDLNHASCAWLMNDRNLTVMDAGKETAQTEATREKFEQKREQAWNSRINNSVRPEALDATLASLQTQLHGYSPREISSTVYRSFDGISDHAKQLALAELFIAELDVRSGNPELSEQNASYIQEMRDHLDDIKRAAQPPRQPTSSLQ